MEDMGPGLRREGGSRRLAFRTRPVERRWWASVRFVRL